MTSTTPTNPTPSSSPSPSPSPSPSLPSTTLLSISNTSTIQSFLAFSAANRRLPQPFRDAAACLVSRSSVPYGTLISIWFAADQGTRPGLSDLLRQSEFVFSSPKPREKSFRLLCGLFCVRSEELKARLKKIEELAERKAYQELVKDITPKKDANEPFSSYKDQIGFGLHVVVTMGTGYLVGYAAFRALFSHNPVMNAAGGILGLVLAMLVETLLFIIKTSNADPSSTDLKAKKNQ
ncbi:hypothetical protein AKJ16_DCAP08601 [Drosera capensis]